MIADHSTNLLTVNILRLAILRRRVTLGDLFIFYQPLDSIDAFLEIQTARQLLQLALK
jgi:hypothetical protein